MALQASHNTPSAIPEVIPFRDANWTGWLRQNTIHNPSTIPERPFIPNFLWPVPPRVLLKLIPPKAG